MTDMKTALTVEFSPEFMTAVGNTLSIYDKALDQLRGLVNGNGFTDDYGMCNTEYQMVYITPKDIASYVDYVFKAVSQRLIDASIGDLEKFSVTMAKQFMQDNCNVDTSRDNIFAKSAYADPRVQTMMDLLVQTENTFFDRRAFSKFEMIERARLMKKDYETMNALHLKPTLTAVIKSLPGVIKDQWKDSRCFDTFKIAAVMSYVETFILFVVSLNLATLEQMIGYAQPIATFIRKEKNPTVTQESVDDSKYSPMFVVLTSGKAPIISGAIKKITKSNWSHVSISFDPTLQTLYSYAMAKTEFAPSSQGLRKESIGAYYMKDCDIAVFGMFVPNHIVVDMQKLIDERIQGKTTFDFGLLFKKAFNDDAKGSAKSHKKICTTFVNDLIEEVTKKKYSGKSVPSPQQMYDAGKLHENQVFKVYEGMSNDYSPEQAVSIIKQNASSAPSKPFVEYVTECCFINTNDIRMRMRVPFDFNLKNIVLQDQTDGFKETRTAIHFMIRDNRSPIRAYLLKYTTKRNLNDRLEFEPVLNLLRPYFHPENMDGAKYEYEKLSFHTDLNWISRIAFNNQFSDGDYRTDGLGNDARSPIVQTLSMLERMYCGCTLKTNEELANHICTLAALMNTILEHDCGLCNRDYIRDVVAVLGECFTKCVIRLFNNNATAVIYTDDMPDTMVPGITYCEQFVYMEADNNQQQQNNAGASGISFSQNTQEKTGALGKIKTLLRQFVAWIANTLRKAPLLFARTNGQRAEFVEKHEKLNNAIGAAMGATNPFQVNCKNVPVFQIPLKDLLSEMDKWGPEIKSYYDWLKRPDNNQNTQSDNDAKLADLRAVLYPGVQNNISKEIIAKEGEERKKAIEDYLLFSRINVQPGDQACYKNGPMDAKTWSNICECLKGTPKLLEEFSSKASKALEQFVKIIDTQNPEEQTPGQSVLVDLLREIQEMYITPAVNIYSSKMFDVYYRYYKSIVDNFNVQYKPTQSKVDQQASEVAQSNAAPQQQTPEEG